MKLFFVLISALFISAFNSSNYPVAKLYAFQQKVSGGANFSSAEKNKAKMKYHLYLELKKGREISVETVWINGMQMNFDLEETGSPVTYEKTVTLGKGNQTEILIPATSNKLLRIVVRDEAGDKKAPPKYKTYSLLILYREANKSFYLGTKNFSKLLPEIKQ